MMLGDGRLPLTGLFVVRRVRLTMSRALKRNTLLAVHLAILLTVVIAMPQSLSCPPPLCTTGASRPTPVPSAPAPSSCPWPRARRPERRPPRSGDRDRHRRVTC